MNAPIKSNIAKLALALALLCSPLLKAANFNFHIDLDTAALNSAPNAPFFLDFQLNEGSGSLTNSATLSNFTFDGGSAAGSPSIFGNATGSLGGTVSLFDSPASPFNEFFQGFTAGTTGIHFDASISQNSPGATPDGFAVAILDSEPGFPQIATNAPDGVSLVSLGIKAANSLADVGVYGSTLPAGVTATVIPEPSDVAAFLGIAVSLLAGFHRFGKRRMA